MHWPEIGAPSDYNGKLKLDTGVGDRCASVVHFDAASLMRLQRVDEWGKEFGSMI